MPSERYRVEKPKIAKPHNTCEARRRFIKRALAAASVPWAAGSDAAAQAVGAIRGFDHVALPMLNTDAMLAFYRGLGLQVSENAQACSVYVGTQMINFHRPATWQRETFTLRAPAAKPPCGDLCFVWEGTPEALKAMLDRANAKVVEGPVPRQGGRRAPGSSIYVRDPDGNLLEFISYS
jgi:catechol 2,3-dioxygenase-like lactoylglutathione lyase family enzyme